MKRKLAKLERSKKDEEDLSFSDDDEESSSENESEDMENEVAELHSTRDKTILKERAEALEKKKKLVPYKNKQKLLMLSSRGITTRYRHLMEDIRALLPQHRKEVKHDTKKRLFEINELCEVKSCNGCMFFEVRKKKDLYLWLTRAPNGPSIKFLLSNVHTMDELQLTGNCLLGSRPLLSFTAEFDRIPYLQLCKEMLSLTFGTPRGHPKSKPFIDRILQFYYLDGRIWVRNYQIADETKDDREVKKLEKIGEESFTLHEIGPRFVLTVVKIFDGSFTGRPIYENPKYVSPNEERAEIKREAGMKYIQKKRSERNYDKKIKTLEEKVPVDELSNKRIFS